MTKEETLKPEEKKACYTMDKMREMEIGQVLEVLADDKGIKTDMPAWCESTGNEFLGMEEEDSEYRVYVRKRVE
jgi:tRNA 2-thiouridine synthesizing protein A